MLLHFGFLEIGLHGVEVSVNSFPISWLICYSAYEVCYWVIFFFSSYISLWIALSSLYLYQSEPQQAEALESRCPWLFMNAWIISFMHKGMFWEPSSFPTICFNVCMPDASYFFQPSCLHPSFHPMVVREYQLSLVQLYYFFAPYEQRVVKSSQFGKIMFWALFEI